VNEAPQMCPRCGNLEFKSTAIAMRLDDEGQYRKWRVYRCAQCELSFNGEMWRDERGEEWTMAESGT